MDGKTFMVAEAEVGVNMPPMHPNCRCTVVPVVDSALDAEEATEHEQGVKIGEDALDIDPEQLSSQQYRMKYHGITGNSMVDDRICDYSRNMLTHRSGTHGEDLVLLDADTGSLIINHTTGTGVDSVQYTAEVEEAIEKAHSLGKRILAIHNHPTGFPPTADDCVSALTHGYDIGVVCGHNGTLYTYKPANYTLTEGQCRTIHEDISYQVNTGAELDKAWSEMLELHGMYTLRR